MSIEIFASWLRRREASGGPRIWTALAAVLGGGLVMAGALLPWLTLFAGLHPYPGIMGLWGKLLFAAGAATAAAGAACVLTSHRFAPAVCGVMGPALVAASVFLVVRQQAAYRELVASHPMMVPGMGPGLYVALAGAAVATVVMFAAWRRQVLASARAR
jgi:hypothetical protein